MHMHMYNGMQSHVSCTVHVHTCTVCTYVQLYIIHAHVYNMQPLPMATSTVWVGQWVGSSLGLKVAVQHSGASLSESSSALSSEGG